MKGGATMHLEIICVKSVYHNVYPHLLPPKGEYEKGSNKVCVYIEKAEEIKKADVFGKSDGYVVFKGSNDTKEKKTHVVKNDLNPKWKSGFRIKCCSNEEIIFNLYDHDLNSKDDHIGTSKMKAEKLSDSEWKSQALVIDVKGKLHVSMKRQKVVSPGYKRLVAGQSGVPSVVLENTFQGQF